MTTDGGRWEPEERRRLTRWILYRSSKMSAVERMSPWTCVHWPGEPCAWGHFVSCASDPLSPETASLSVELEPKQNPQNLINAFLMSVISKYDNLYIHWQWQPVTSTCNPLHVSKEINLLGKKLKLVFSFPSNKLLYPNSTPSNLQPLTANSPPSNLQPLTVNSPPQRFKNLHKQPHM